jgi:DNA-binding transcriptional LysR family regulator
MVPSQTLEKDIAMGGTDFVIACHAPDDPVLAHKKIIKEEYSLIIPKSWQKDFKNKTDNQVSELLFSRTYIRHNNLNPDIFLDGFSIQKVPSEILVDHMIGVRAAVISGQGWSYVPSLLIKDAVKFNQVFEIKSGIQTDSHLCLWWRRENKESKKIVEAIATWIRTSCMKN